MSTALLDLYGSNAYHWLDAYSAGTWTEESGSGNDLGVTYGTPATGLTPGGRTYLELHQTAGTGDYLQTPSFAAPVEPYAAQFGAAIYPLSANFDYMTILRPFNDGSIFQSSPGPTFTIYSYSDPYDLSAYITLDAWNRIVVEVSIDDFLRVYVNGTKVLDQTSFANSYDHPSVWLAALNDTGTSDHFAIGWPQNDARFRVASPFVAYKASSNFTTDTTAQAADAILASYLRRELAASISMGGFGLSADAKAIVKADVAITLDPFTLAATAKALVKGTAAITLSPFTLSATASVKVKADAAITLSAFTLSATMQATHKLDAAITLSPFTLSADFSASTPVGCTFQLTMDPFVLVADASVKVKADAAITLDAFGVSIQALGTNFLSAPIVLGLVGIAATAQATTRAAAAITLDPFGLVATAYHNRPPHKDNGWRRPERDRPLTQTRLLAENTEEAFKYRKGGIE